MDTIKQFKDNGYTIVRKFIDTQQCENLVDIMQELAITNKAQPDIQCLKSYGIYGYSKFEKLLENVQFKIEQSINKKLIPTYSYARLYQPDEELKIHTDRPACEVSATLCLGWSGDQWSIYMADQTENPKEADLTAPKGEKDFEGVMVKNIAEIKMDVGDIVIYKGMDKFHWRNKFKGDWQVQVFLHYVDANGPHTEWKYDKRISLSLPKPVGSEITNGLTTCATFENHITEAFCDNLINTYSKPDIKKDVPLIGGNAKTGLVNTAVRNVKRVLLPQNVGIGATLTATALNANNYWWQYNITHSNQTEFLMYDINDHYIAHTDMEHQHSYETRKLTVLAFLNDDFEGGKFFLNPGGTPFYPKQSKGTVLVFPSYMVHGVEPVTKGVRYSAVTWMVGPYFK